MPILRREDVELEPAKPESDQNEVGISAGEAGQDYMTSGCGESGMAPTN